MMKRAWQYWLGSWRRTSAQGGQAKRPLLLEALEDRILLTASPLIDKDVYATSSAATSGHDVVIGEVVTYQLTVTIREGVSTGVVVTDQMADGMEFVAGSLTVVPNDSSGDHIATDYADEATGATYAGNALTINLGTVVNVFDGDPTNDTIVIRYDVVVGNTAGHQDGAAQPNTATVTDGSYTDTATASVNVVESQLEIIKEVEGDSTLTTGETVTYQITVGHGADSHASAFDLNLTDALPGGLTGLTIVSATIQDGVQASVDVGSAFSISGGQLVTTGDVDLLLDGGVGVSQTLVIVLSGVVQSDATSTAVVTNTATVTWTSLDGTVAGERTGDGGVDDYSVSGLASITIEPSPVPPPPPPPEPIPEPPHAPAEAAEAPSVEPAVFTYDILHNNPTGEAEGGEFRLELVDLDYTLPLVPVSPLYSGSAPAGTTLVVSLLDDSGQVLGDQSVLVDAGGNWLTVFPAVYLADYPYAVEVRHEAWTQIDNAVSDQTALLFYSPATNVITVWKVGLSEEHLGSESAEQAFGGVLHDGGRSFGFDSVFGRPRLG